MPTNRKRTRRPRQKEAWITEYLLYGYYTLPSGERSIKKSLLYGETPVPPWADVRDELLPGWIEAHPCTRPFAWWNEETPEPRRRIGGSGDPKGHVRLEFGVTAPNTWWARVSPGDPPAYESQAAFLERHNFLTAAEKKWLAQHPEALEHEKIDYLQGTEETSLILRLLTYRKS